MGRLNEFIARTANAEDKVKGRFFESRFKCQALLDDIATITGLVYADLNLIAAGLASAPEDSYFTSIYERIRDWQKANMPSPASPSAQSISLNTDASSDSWLCPIASTSQRRGILNMSETEYFELVDQSGRIMREGKGFINPELEPILVRIGAKSEAWIDTVTNFGSIFNLVAGRQSSIRKFAEKIGVRWLVGTTRARASFL
jgi:hypothetical protein